MADKVPLTIELGGYVSCPDLFISQIRAVLDALPDGETVRLEVVGYKLTLAMSSKNRDLVVHLITDLLTSVHGLAHGCLRVGGFTPARKLIGESVTRLTDFLRMRTQLSFTEMEQRMGWHQGRIGILRAGQRPLYESQFRLLLETFELSSDDELVQEVARCVRPDMKRPAPRKHA